MSGDRPRCGEARARMLWAGMALSLCLLPAFAHAEPALQNEALTAVGADQGVYAVAEDGTVLAALNETRPVHPASVSKVATTLALLDRLGPDHRFETTVAASGPISDHLLRGDLRLRSAGDPFFIFESAFFVLAELHRLGISRVQGRLQVSGPLIFNWQPDPAGERLQRALAGQDGASAWPAVSAREPDLGRAGLRAVALAFETESPRAIEDRPLLVYRSPRLVTIVKALNSYSNNVFHPLADAVGGPSAVERIARERVPAAERNEIVIENGAGAGFANRMSPRAAAAIVRALEEEAKEHGLRLVDLLPVAGIDQGTLHERVASDEPVGALVGKTGTYGSIGISALAGVVRTKAFGEVTFAVLNTGLAVPKARARQDAFVHAVMRAGTAVPFPYEPGPSPLDEIRVEAAH